MLGDRGVEVWNSTPIRADGLHHLCSRIAHVPLGPWLVPDRIGTGLVTYRSNTLTPTNMKLQFAFAIALLSGVSLSAQTTPAASPMQKDGQPMAVSADHTCMMDTDAAAWTSLGLSEDQMATVQAAQSACKSECAAMKDGASAEDKALHHAQMERHTATIQSTLSKEQYVKWQKWCEGRTVKSTK